MADQGKIQPEALLTPAEVGDLLRVEAKTVTLWAKAGRISAVRTPSGRYRIRESVVRALLNGDGS